jgi:isopentenyl phosphate kinase
VDVVLLKLGGSLITEKARAETPRPEIIARLAGEIARAARETSVRLIAGHGSGSFGHVAARDSGIAGGLRSPDQLPGVSRTQERAAALHRLVIQALEEAGALPFSLAPSSCMVAAGGRVTAFHDEPLLLVLERGLLPVLYGDVVLDRERGVSICSTETVFDAVARCLLERGHAVRRVLWLGETDGLYDAEGRTIARVSAADVLDAVGDPSGADVTGGMRHRIESALELARLGVPSVLINGLRAGELERALKGEAVQGTEVV